VEEDKKKEIYFTGILSDGTKDDFVLPVFLICCVIKYTLWNFKLRHKLPGWYSFHSEFFYTFNLIVNCSNKLLNMTRNCDWLKQNRED
jgi:hypothetical protein